MVLKGVSEVVETTGAIAGMALRVSVVIPTLNEADTIAKLIEHTRRQNPHEIVVVDGGSQDDTVRLAHGADKVLRSTPGRAHQQNVGATACSGDVVLFLHADCLLVDRSLDQIAAHMQDERYVGGCLTQRIDGDGWLLRVIERGNNCRAKRIGWAYGDQGIFVRRTVFDELGGFPDVRLMEDLWLVKKLKRSGRFTPIGAEMLTSARRWQNKGAIRQTLRNWMLLTLTHAGVSPNRLARFYPAVR